MPWQSKSNPTGNLLALGRHPQWRIKPEKTRFKRQRSLYKSAACSLEAHLEFARKCTFCVDLGIKNSWKILFKKDGGR